MTVVSLNIFRQKYSNKAFLFKAFLVPKFCFCFYAKFCNHTNLKVLISKYHNSLLNKILVWKYPNKAFFVPNLSCFVREILQFNKFEGGNFKYDNSFWKFYPKNTQTKSIGYQFFEILVQKYPNKSFWNDVEQKFGIWRCWFQIWQYLFKLLAQNYLIRHLYSQI